MISNYKISIPKPCHEDWNAMTQEDKGRFCSVCAKSVVDFTGLDNEQVSDYLNQNKDKKICGRFRKDQLEPKFTFTVPEAVLYQKRSFHKTFFLALFVVMGTTLFSCKNYNGQTLGEVEVMGDTTYVKVDSVPEKESIDVGKVEYDPSKPGKVLPPPPKPKVDEVKFVKPKPSKEVEVPLVTMGVMLSEPPAVEMDPVPPREIKGNN